MLIGRFFASKYSFIFFLLLSLGWFQATDACVPALTDLGLNGATASLAEVEAQVKERTRPFLFGQPELISASGRQSATASLERPFINEIFRAFAQAAREDLSNLGSAWLRAYQEQIKLEKELHRREEAARQEEILKLGAQAEDIGRHILQVREGINQQESGQASSRQLERLDKLQRAKTEIEREIARLKEEGHREMSQEPSDRLQRATEVLEFSAAYEGQSGRSGAWDSSEARRRAAHVLIEGAVVKLQAADLERAKTEAERLGAAEWKGSRVSFDGILQEEFKKFLEALEAKFLLIEINFERQDFGIRWQLFDELLEKAFRDFKFRLQEELALVLDPSILFHDSIRSTAWELEMRNLQALIPETRINSFRPQWVNDGLELSVGQGLLARYEPKIGSMIVYPKDGLFSIQAPLVIKLHGDGTTQSNAGSWRSVQPLFKSFGLNSVALALPNSGPIPSVATSFESPEAIAAYLQFVFEYLRDEDPEDRPFIALGRSAGSTKAGLHFLLYEILYPSAGEVSDQRSAPDALILSSHSNPRTVEEQVVEVFRSAGLGLFEVVPESLESFRELSRDYLELLEKLRENNPSIFYQTQGAFDRVLYLQGVSDEDAAGAGQGVVQEAIKFAEDFMPSSHVIVYENPLADPDRYPEIMDEKGEIDYSKVSPDLMEATHFLVSSHADMSMADWQRLYPNIKIREEDVPKLRTQALQTLAVHYLFLDYLADLSPYRTQGRGQEVADRIQSFRQLQTKGEGTYRDWFLDLLIHKKKIKSREDYENAEASMRGTLAQRIKAMEHYFLSAARQRMTRD
ncbi:MAG: hypothetical protein EA369_04630 [Bradymonadales bacterium]|nr:MAG: hypothetical protein EA369_04630 [Bradymonadales bacterium]